MYVLSCGVVPLRCKRQVLRAAALALVIPLAACASSSAQAPNISWPGEAATRVAGYTAEAEPRAPRRVQMEADGQESQVLPFHRKITEPDDPTQPFSPNYGRVHVHPTNVTVPVEATPIPTDLPADFREKLVYATSN